MRRGLQVIGIYPRREQHPQQLLPVRRPAQQRPAEPTRSEPRRVPRAEQPQTVGEATSVERVEQSAVSLGEMRPVLEVKRNHVPCSENPRRLRRVLAVQRENTVRHQRGASGSGEQQREVERPNRSAIERRSGSEALSPLT